MKNFSSKRSHLLVVSVLAMFGLHTSLLAQQTTVRGRVVSANDQPIAGATIAVRGGTASTSSDAQGRFTLPVPGPAAVLVVSRVGYATGEVSLNGRTDVVVKLTDQAVQLDELVVVGYGTQRRSDVTGSVASLSRERLEEKPNTSVVQALQGALPGVSVSPARGGAEPGLAVQVRGRNSISASTSPLVVVDGIPYNGPLSELNPGDVASIEVLKDASAKAIYGARGSNGVILVTSKKGVVGKPRVSYSGYVGTQKVANLPRLMDAREFAAFKCVRLATTPAQSCESVLTASELSNLQAGVNTSWVDEATRTGQQQQHELSFSGGSEDTRYYVGGSLLNVEGVARGDKFDRFTARVNLDQRLASWLRVGTSTQGVHTDRGGQPASFAGAFFGNPLISPYNGDGTIAVVPWAEDPATNNPLEGLLAIRDDLNRRLFTSNYLDVTIPRVPGLSYRLNAGLDIANRNSGSYYGRNTSTGRGVLGLATVSNTTRSDWTLENIARYTREIGRHNLDFTGLYGAQSNALETRQQRMQGFPNDVLGYRSTVPLLITPSDDVTESKLLSQMGRLNYSYDSRYLATLTARRDGYSGFGANNKYGVFPSLALGWNVSNESFFPFKESVDQLKLRFSYGKNGNQAITPYRTFSQFDDRSYLTGDATAPGYIPITLGNPNLKWETTLSTNVGFDLGIFGERVLATVDAYSSKTSDLLLRRAISSVHGISSIFENIGQTQNRGVELRLSTVNLERGGIQWRTELNLGANRNKIVDLYGDQTDDIANGWFIGRPIDVNYGHRFAGIWQQGDNIAASAQPTAKPGDVRIEDLNGDGKIDPLDRTFIGSLEPSYAAGLVNTVTLRGLTFSAYLNTVQGVTRANSLLGTNQVFSDVRRNTLLREYWTPENRINSYPANSNTSNPLSVPFYEDASFVRLQDVTLSYDLPAGLRARLGAESLRFYVNGRNLWTRTQWSGLDPEFTASEQRTIPLERLITGGLNVRF